MSSVLFTLAGMPIAVSEKAFRKHFLELYKEQVSLIGEKKEQSFDIEESVVGDFDIIIDDTDVRITVEVIDKGTPPTVSGPPDNWHPGDGPDYNYCVISEDIVLGEIESFDRLVNDAVLKFLDSQEKHRFVQEVISEVFTCPKCKTHTLIGKCIWCGDD